MKIFDKIGLFISIGMILCGIILKYQAYDDYYAYILTGSICLIAFITKFLFKKLGHKSA